MARYVGTSRNRNHNGYACAFCGRTFALVDTMLEHEHDCPRRAERRIEYAKAVNRHNERIARHGHQKEGK